MFRPVIKWSGSKRSQANEIVAHFPKKIDTYYEPFVGGGSVMRTLLESDIKVNRIVCSDLNGDLMNLWINVKNHPEYLIENYAEMHIRLSTRPTEEEKKKYYEYIRQSFNRSKLPMYFMLLNRTCYNGLIRYNSKGEFNSPFHLNRNGIDEVTFCDIVDEWSDLLNEKNVEFEWHSYEEIRPKKGDFMYLDPPYANTGKSMYLGDFDNLKFFDWLKEQDCGWALSYDGKSGNDDNTFDVPKELYDEHLYIKSGNSSFKRIKGSDNNAIVYESLYLKK